MGKKCDTEAIDEYIINNYPAKKPEEIAKDIHVSYTTVYYRIKDLKSSNKIIEQVPTEPQKTLAQQRKEWAKYSNHRPYEELIN